jgi:hypothetical protein
MISQESDKIKLLAEKKAFGIRKVLPLGHSYAIVLPKFWVELFCTEIDNKYYMEIDVQDDVVRIHPVDTEALKNIHIKA